MIVALPLALSLVCGDVEWRPDVEFVRTPDGPLQLDLALPLDDGGALRPALVYVHGGAYRAGARADGHALIRRFARGGYVAASIDYRLVDRATYPAIVGDVEDAVRYLRTNAIGLRVDPERIGIVGHAAGAQLAAHVALTGAPADPEFGEGAGVVPSRVACGAGYSTPCDFLDPDLGAASREVVDAFLGHARAMERDAKARGASPLTWVDPGDPPFMLVHGTADELVPFDQSLALRDALRRVGVATELVAVEGAGHRFRDPDAERRVAEFLDRHLGGHAADVEAPPERGRAPDGDGDGVESHAGGGSVPR